MKLLKFTKSRKKLFIGPLIIFLGLPLLCALSMVLKIPCPLGIICLPNLFFYFLLPASVLGSGFGKSLFEWEAFGMAPKGLSGWVITIIFYLVLSFSVSFLLCWVGSFKKDK